MYVTTMMTAPAELRVTSGGASSSQSLSAGIHHFQIPFSPGVQQFVVLRQGKAIISSTGQPIADRIEHYDFFPASGFAYGN